MTRFLYLILLYLAPLSLFAANDKGGEFIAKKGVEGVAYNFWVYEPTEYRDDKHRLPLIIFLHGASLCGNNIQRVRRYGVLDAIDKGLQLPMFVAAPQNPGGAWNPKKLCDMIDWMERNYNIDTTRIYVLGMSLGGYGTLDMVGSCPERIAAAMALCGGTSLKDMSRMGEVPLWIMHGTADRAVKIGESKKVVEFLQTNNMDSLLRYNWLQGKDHGYPARLFYMQKTYDWLLSHSTADNPKEVDTMIEFDDEDFRNTYIYLREDQKYYDQD